jgi:hypothetical protein
MPKVQAPGKRMNRKTLAAALDRATSRREILPVVLKGNLSLGVDDRRHRRLERARMGVFATDFSTVKCE